MPSLLHEAIVDLFRAYPRLAPDLLAKLGVEVPEFDEVRVESADFSQLSPAQFLADLLILLVRGVPVLAIVLEAQLDARPAKHPRGPDYGAAAAPRHGCPACLVVVTPDETVARWARSRIDVGPGASLQPIVFGPDSIPAIDDPETAIADPELAVLSAVAHAKDADPDVAARVALAALAACLDLDDERGPRYADVVQALLSAGARVALEALMQSPQKYEFQSEFARKYFGAGRAEGRAEGKVEGRAEGVLLVLERRGVLLSADQRTLLLATTDVATLDRWLINALDATTAVEVFR